MEQDSFRQHPPRHLNYYSQAVILCSGLISQIGWIFFGFGMIFLWIFGLNSEAVYWFQNRKDWIPTTGVVQKIEPTNFSENERTIYAIHFDFTANGQNHTGKIFDKKPDYQVNENINLTYNGDNPEEVRVEGKRSRPFAAWIFFIVVIFPLVGLIMVALELRKNHKALQLILHGYFTKGKMLSKRETGSSITTNNTTYPIYEYKFEYMADTGKYETTCKTHEVDRVEDEEEEFILYDRFDQSYSVVYDAIPNAPIFDEYGTMQNISPKRAYVLIAPILNILINSLVAWIML